MTGSDGRIYAVGGDNTSGNAIATVEAFNPSTNTWTAAASLPQALGPVAATKGTDGRIYATGGGAVYAYTPASNTWTTAGNLTVTRSGLAMTTGPDGRLYAMGGYTGAYPGPAAIDCDQVVGAAHPNTSGPSAAVDVLGPNVTLSASSSPAGAGITVSGSNFAASATVGIYWGTVATGTLLATGATNGSGTLGQTSVTIPAGAGPGTYAITFRDSLSQYPVTRSFTVFIPTPTPTPTWASNPPSWQTVTPLNAARWNAGAASAADGTMYVVGGAQSTLSPGVFLSSVEMYGPGAGAWTFISPLPTALFGVAAVVGPDGLLYAIGGSPNLSEITSAVETYNPQTHTWSAAPPYPVALAFDAAAVGTDGLIFVMGNADKSVYAYSPTSHTWVAKSPMPVALGNMGVVAGADGRIYAVGGYETNAVEAFTPAQNTWTTVASLPGPVPNSTSAAEGADGRVYASNGTNTYAYAPANNTWVAIGNLPSGHTDQSMVTGPGGRVYAIGGRNGGTPTSEVVAYGQPRLSRTRSRHRARPIR